MMDKVIPSTMSAIVFNQVGDESVLHMQQQPVPVPGSHQLLVKVAAAGVNRADLLQRKGLYPPPPGVSAILGLEIAGEIVAIGEKVTEFLVGDAVFGLVSGGGYAEYCLLEEGLAMQKPSQFDMVQAAAIPEAFFTASETLFEYGQLAAGETVLIHAGASGVGMAAMQMALLSEALVFFTAGTVDKVRRTEQLLQQKVHGIHYKSQNVLEEIMQHTHGAGVDVILDFVGAPYFQDHLQLLKTKGRLLQVAVMGGYMTEINLALLIKKRLSIQGFAMRQQSLLEKYAIKQRFVARWWSALLAGALKPVVDCTFALADAASAHRYLQENRNVGKVVLKV